jgi:glycosyltransferase involved in cell wall biosynthesis
VKILVVSAFYPPYTIGGAEICARNLNNWLTAHGHEVAVVTAAPSAESACWNAEYEGYRLYRVEVPRIYTVFEANTAPEWQKPIWHLQDLFDPRNNDVFERIIAEFKPDFVHVHWIQGLGYNALKAFGKHDIPTAITLHDLSLACVRTTMFNKDGECGAQCAGCKFSARRKQGYLRSIPRLGFISPSQANLDRVSALMDVGHIPKFHILNPNIYPAPTTRHHPGPHIRFTYAGRLEKTKGINLLLDVLDELARDFDFHLTAMGTGPEEEHLRARYGDAPWLTLTGQVPMQRVSDEMAQSDLLLVPSLWFENSPGVVFQAMQVSLPAMVSNKGGLPELVRNGENGILAPPGDRQAWKAALTNVLSDPASVEHFRPVVQRDAAALDYDALAHRIVDAFGAIAGAQIP